MSESENPYNDVARAVWAALNERRWFGKHVDDEEIESLEEDIRNAIQRTLEPYVS